jgi:hypothetical protein
MSTRRTRSATRAARARAASLSPSAAPAVADTNRLVSPFPYHATTLASIAEGPVPVVEGSSIDIGYAGESSAALPLSPAVTSYADIAKRRSPVAIASSAPHERLSPSPKLFQ